MSDNHVVDANAEDISIENKKRRRFLTGITAGFGAIGGATAAIPFVLSMSPSERAKNAGKPVVLLKRTSEMMQGLDKISSSLADPDSNASVQPSYAKNEERADDTKPELLVMLGVCTHLGCSPVEKLAIGPDPTTNMEVPPYKYEGNVITIGEDDGRGGTA